MSYPKFPKELISLYNKYYIPYIMSLKGKAKQNYMSKWKVLRMDTNHDPL